MLRRSKSLQIRPWPDTYVRGLRKGAFQGPYPLLIWTCPSYNTSAMQGEKAYTYTLVKKLRIVHADDVFCFVKSMYPSMHDARLDCIAFANFSNQRQEQRLLTKLAAVAESYMIDGVFRMQGDGPAFVFFGHMVERKIAAEDARQFMRD